jgi:hypothetical protein
MSQLAVMRLAAAGLTGQLNALEVVVTWLGLMIVVAFAAVAWRRVERRWKHPL